MDDPGLHLELNGGHARDRVLAARVAALQEARAEAGDLLTAQRTSDGLDVTEELAARHRARVLRRAEVMEAWLLRPLDLEDETDG